MGKITICFDRKQGSGADCPCFYPGIAGGDEACNLRFRVEQAENGRVVSRNCGLKKIEYDCVFVPRVDKDE
jgi:hypothetical protein